MRDNHDEYEEEGRRLLAPLAGQPVGPSTIDIRRAISDGRRRRRTRRVAGVGAVAVVIALAAAGVPVALDATGGTADEAPPVAADTPAPSLTPSPAPSPTPDGPTPPTRCRFERLPVPGDAHQSLVTGGDPTGRFLTGRTYTWTSGDDWNLISGIRLEQVIWDDGEPTVVDFPGYDASFDAINSSGVAVGSSFESNDGGAAVAWVYRDGELTRLPGGSRANAINEQGAIAGSRALDEDSLTERPVVWRSPDAEPEELSVPGETWTVSATDVDADGTVLGAGHDWDQVPDPPEHSFVWLPDGTRHELPMPTTTDEGTITGFTAGTIRDGVIIGKATRERGDDGWDFPVFRYDLRTGEFTPLLDGLQLSVEEWNAHGWLVGNNADGLVLLARSEVVPLPYPEQGEDSEAWPLDRPSVVTVSDAGRVVAGQLNHTDGEDFTTEAVAWRCG